MSDLTLTEFLKKAEALEKASIPNDLSVYLSITHEHLEFLKEIIDASPGQSLRVQGNIYRVVSDD